MPHERLDAALRHSVSELEARGTSKGAELVFVSRLAPAAGLGPRYTLDGWGERPFLRMNSNSYLGLAFHPALRHAEEAAVAQYGTGPGAVRFISGTWQAHVELERRLAAFHGRAATMIFSSAYATTMGVLPSLITPETAVVSDALNHNCIINAIRLARPALKAVYPHNDLSTLEAELQAAVGKAKRALVITDGIFSMRGDWAPLPEIVGICRRYDGYFEENVVLVVDDSHGVGAFGASGRGTEEYTGCLGQVDVLIGTLGKAFGANGGYVTGSAALVTHLRETSPFYIYSNPITAGEAAAALAAVNWLDSPEGHAQLAHLRALTERFERGLQAQGLETIEGSHPVVPLMVRDTARTRALTQHLFEHGILATGLKYPVVPKGDEEIRFQVNADHTQADIDYVLDVLRMSER